jgi:hypothetical protein
VAFVEPALEFLRRHGGTVMFAHQLRRLVLSDGRVRGLDFGDSTTAVGADDAVVLAVPPYAAGAIVPGLQTPVEYRAIINAHFRLSPPAIAPMIGVLHGVAEWIFAFDDRISVTISDAGRLLELPRDQIAWRTFRPCFRRGNWCASGAPHLPRRLPRMPPARAP